MKSSIAWESLSKVFQDAITVARRLEVEWIWIDSLCIIQDSKADWETESSKMCDYYENAYITISASSSNNGTIPFLRERDQQWLPEKFPFTCSDGKVVEVQARRHRGSSMAQLLENLGPLALRGWVWQESVLSTRILHYTESELIWECKTEVSSEDGAKPRGFYSMGLCQKVSKSEKDPYSCWHDLLESYSVRKLTFESDKLPAVSGIAKRIQERVKGTYLAGLWKENLPMELCWSVDYVSSNSSTPNLLPESYIAPSWPWASVHGALGFVDRDPECPFESCVTVVDVQCSVPGLNKFGEVIDGYLILKGLVVQLSVNCRDPEECWTYTVGDDPETRDTMTPDCMLMESEIRKGVHVGDSTVKRARKDDVAVPFSARVSCLRVGHEDDGESEFVYGILLAPCEAVEDTHIRIGLVQLDSEEWFEEALNALLKSSKIHF